MNQADQLPKAREAYRALLAHVLDEIETVQGKIPPHGISTKWWWDLIKLKEIVVELRDAEKELSE